MVGLPFPNSAVDNREQSWDTGTPFSNGGGDIPIDPALSETPLDPALLADSGVPKSEEVPQPPPSYPQYSFSRLQQYPQGPQGDPFAEPPPVYVPMDEPLEPVPLPAKPLKKRKRPPAREEECGFCHGNDAMNKNGEPELMVSCVDCGRSGHPSCMGLDNMGDALRSYEWQCATCKSCSVCRRKGNEASMLICDFCDRGWHMSCFHPPFREPPEGRWHCPFCPRVGESGTAPEQYPAMQSPEIPEMPQYLPPPRESSVASSSRLVPLSDAPEYPITTDASEIEGDPSNSTPRRKNKPRRSRKGKEVSQDGEADQDAGPSTPLPTVRRLRIRMSSPAPVPTGDDPPTIRLRVPARGKGKARDDGVQEESEHGMFDDILSVEDRDTRETSIREADVQRFERARVLAEERLVPRQPPDPPETPVAGPSSRPLRSAAQHTTPMTPGLAGSSMSPAPSSATPAPHALHLPHGLRIRRIRFGDFDIETWYDAPFPEEYASVPDGRLWMCEFCLKYMKSRFSAGRHQTKCKVRHPPGDEIYRDGRISIFEVDGRKNKIYCQNLCLLSKMFLDHKSLFYDVEPFLFYVMTETDDMGAHFIGYFSKEKLSLKSYNLSCIMTLPVRQRQGWGNLLMDFSYLLSKKEGRVGSPEKPLSALGAIGYRNLWTLSIMRYLRNAPPDPRLEDISAATAMTLEDIYNTLVHLNMISVKDSAHPVKPLPGQTIKFPKGRKNGIARKHLQRTQTHGDDKARGPFVPPTKYRIHWDPEQVQQYLARWEAKGYFQLKPEKLKWSPFILSRADKTQAIQNEGGVDPGALSGDATRSASTDVHQAIGRVYEEAESSPDKASAPPPFNLFDDDEVEVVRASAPRESPRTGPVDRVDGSRRRRSSSPSTSPVETRRSKRQEANRAEMPAIRRLRSKDSVSQSTPLRRRVHTPRGDASVLERRKSGHSTRGDSSATSRRRANNNAHPLDDDAALAAQLAMELASPRRELRSRRPSSSDQPSTKRPLSSLVSTPRSASPRKRRKVDSSPEVDRIATPGALGLRRTRSQRALQDERPASRQKPLVSPPQRKSARLTNGHSPVKTPVIALREEEEEDEEPELVVATHIGPPNGVATDGDETKYEDADTPATGATGASRHSDDTVVGGELARHKLSPVALTTRHLHPDAGGEEDGDADAEGEDDLDAEGESVVEDEL
ncbi:hypothetical protein BN946_scf184804.g4 [Trametes cinnabarina]|uniref:Histone acetyltransferase n=1 Tax=Pycnoporus cinnabarinus TaxID=5643 RepID=A0A060S8S1_PYCCI|nr:hypothetical protein BN946_scf184804.g4 [Trametes cinnabarina]